MKKHLVFAALAGLLVPAGALAFTNTEPDAAQQWYLGEDNAWTHWPTEPELAPVKVAVIDSGIDAGHPEFIGRIAGGVSYVKSSWRVDTCGHGTFVAGEIAANPSNGVGIAGIAFNAKLLIAKVVDDDCDVSTSGEIKAIRWAANEGARVINLSIGGIRDPSDPELNSYSAAEEAALEYAYSKGVLVVAAVGNSTQAPKTPWPFADYPAALPHVLGVARDQRGRLRPRVLQPRCPVPRSRRPGRPDLLDDPAQSRRRRDPGLRRHGVLRLRPERVPGRDRHVVRGPAGRRGRRAPARRRPVADAGAGRVDPRALGDRRGRLDWLRRVPGRARLAHRLG